MKPTRVAILAVVPLAGCLVTGSIGPDGSARLTVRLRLVSVAHFETTKKAWESADVVLRNATMTPQKWATFEVDCPDVRKLSTAPGLSTAAIAVTDDRDGTRTISATLKNVLSQPMSPAFVRYEGSQADIAIDVPGEVTRSNAASAAGRTVEWRIPLAESSTHRQTVLSVSFRPSPPDSDDVR